ncbi:MFS transporter [Pokkaliibacter plantistimulans]|uniref:cytochrome-c oxidase n=1 Tax=Pokkaliibacter plantistimulans TaxID=1635171 RepID=A0ABX5LQ51_9GAMM|nr:cytochrome c oxidase subunit 3 [Pokkaliibacter plantistimulans]PXF28789.1 MFS transporter [Pokkaliibacter plantistimulans]
MNHQHYYVPEQSHWPIVAAFALFFLAAGTAHTIIHGQPLLLIIGLGAIAYLFVGWFGEVIRENQAGLLDNDQVDRSFRLGMGWFIFSEVMFFAAFFGALFYIRHFSVPWLAGEGAKGISHMLWPAFEASWPVMSPPDSARFPGPEETVDPWHLPFINTLLLVSSSITLTIAHHALKKGHRAVVIAWMFVTVALGVSFLVVQGYEYHEAYTQMGLTLHAGVYGATFFILTGFHGMHVTLGTIILIVMLSRILRGHFSARRHFGFEASAWYWHFVDVVWLGLFIFVYVL